MLHMGQYLLVWRYFTIQLLQTGGKGKQTLRPSGSQVLGLDGVPGWLGQVAQRLPASWVGTRAWKNQPGSRELTSMETLCDGGGIHEVASAQAADDVFIQVFDLYSDLLLRTHPPSPSPITLPNPNPGACPAWESPLSSHLTAKPRTLHGQQGLSSRGLTLPLAQQRSPRIAGAPFTWTGPTFLSQGRPYDDGGTTRRRLTPEFGNSDHNRAGALCPPPLRRRTGRPAGPGLSSSRPQSAPLADHSSNPAAPAPRSVAGPSCTLTGAGSEASSRSQSGPPEETPS